jgi:hypothetical protein
MEIIFTWLNISEKKNLRNAQTYTNDLGEVRCPRYRLDHVTIGKAAMDLIKAPVPAKFGSRGLNPNPYDAGEAWPFAGMPIEQ